MGNYYSTTISLDEEDKKSFDNCKKYGHSIIEIFRRGMKAILRSKKILKKDLTK